MALRFSPSPGTAAINLYSVPTRTIAQLAALAGQITAPTVTRLLSGSGTYIPPTGCTKVWLRAVGAGGGGGGSANSGLPNYGLVGGDTTFAIGAETYTAYGGGPGGASGDQGAGGVYSANVDSSGLGFGISGGSGGFINGAYISGGHGGNTPFGGGGGTSGAQIDGLPGVNQTGGGGGGGGATPSQSGMGGGGGGGYFELTFRPSASGHAYSVGAGGAAGAAGTGGHAGGAGGNGSIYITEYYGLD